MVNEEKAYKDILDLNSHLTSFKNNKTQNSFLRESFSYKAEEILLTKIN